MKNFYILEFFCYVPKILMIHRVEKNRKVETSFLHFASSLKIYKANESLCDNFFNNL